MDCMAQLLYDCDYANVLPQLRKELIWFYQEGASILFPDIYEEFIEPIPEVIWL